MRTIDIGDGERVWYPRSGPGVHGIRGSRGEWYVAHPSNGSAPGDGGEWGPFRTRELARASALRADERVRTHDLERRIAALGIEAQIAGDGDQVALCERALDGDRRAWAECLRVLEDAEAMGGRGEGGAR